MFPYITFFDRKIGTYQIMILFGIFTIGIYSYWSSKRKGYNEIDIIITLLISAIGMFLGSHLLYALVNYKEIKYIIQNIKNYNSLSQFMIQLNLVFGGSVFYGGLFGGIMAAYLLLEKKVNTFKYQADIITPGIPLFHFFGRVGCFMAGCCFGKTSNLGFTYSHSIIEKANGIRRFPVQLCEAFINLIIFIILTNKYISKKFKGNLLVLYLLFYSITRFFTEIFRGDTYRGIWLHLSTSQWISIVVFIFSSIILWKKIGHKNKFIMIRSKL